jgi:hypothetical protein
VRERRSPSSRYGACLANPCPQSCCSARLPGASIDGADTSRLSPHFVHLPDDVEGAGSLWYEAAMDAIVLFDREGRISRFLRSIRRSMAEGKLQRKSAYGHPYWIKRGREVARVQ